MTYFEEKGVELQCCAYSLRDAQKKFRRSCTLCVSKGRRASCEACAIARAFDTNVKSVFVKNKATYTLEITTRF